MLTIKQAKAGDWEAIQRIGRQTFAETFAATNTEADMRRYLQESFAEAKLKQELSNPNSYFYLAHTGGELVAYLKLNTKNAQTELQDPEGLEIERIYALQKCQRQGIGQALLDQALAVARDLGLAYVWLGVWEHNQKALAFYQKNGFEGFDKHIFRLGEDEQTDILMKKPL